MSVQSAGPAAEPSGGRARRRLDVVLDPDFVAGLTELPLPELRSRRHLVDQEETDLSYVRRLLHGRIDIVRAELERRSGGAPLGSLVEELPAILSDDRPASPFGSGRLLVTEPSDPPAHRRRVEALVADVDLADVSARSDEELDRVLAAYEREEHAVSEQRHRVQAVSDELGAEVARRYGAGEASVDALLAEEGVTGGKDGT